MNCPVCKTIPLEPRELEPGLRANSCATCGGSWLDATEYRRWREAQDVSLPERTDVAMPTAVTDSPGAKLCPSCGHILLRYGVGHDVAFALDTCGNCNSVWLDGSEWEILRQKNLHDDIHLMFTSVWQRAVRQEARRRVFDAQFRDRFGDADYAEIRRIRDWLDNHPERAALLAFLTAADPFSN